MPKAVARRPSTRTHRRTPSLSPVLHRRVAPEEPADAPEEPADAPEEPADAPEEPAYAPKEPADAPEEPADAPEEPADTQETPDAPEEPADVPEVPDAPEDAVQSRIDLLDAAAARRRGTRRRRGTVRTVSPASRATFPPAHVDVHTSDKHMFSRLVATCTRLGAVFLLSVLVAALLLVVEESLRNVLGSTFPTKTDPGAAVTSTAPMPRGDTPVVGAPTEG